MKKRKGQRGERRRQPLSNRSFLGFFSSFSTWTRYLLGVYAHRQQHPRRFSLRPSAYSSSPGHHAGVSRHVRSGACGRVTPQRLRPCGGCAAHCGCGCDRHPSHRHYSCDSSRDYLLFFSPRNLSPQPLCPSDCLCPVKTGGCGGGSRGGGYGRQQQKH